MQKPVVICAAIILLLLGLHAYGETHRGAEAGADAPAAERKPAPAFTFTAAPLSKSVRKRVVGSSWRKGCPVPLAGLRYLTVSYRDFKGRPQVGELIVSKDSVRAIRKAFRMLYSRRFPIRRMNLVDDYGASDFKSIEADNTSAFNCRQRTGGGGWSQHAYGRAVDVNPIENPYVFADGTTSHPASRPYLDRSKKRPGMALPGGTLVRAFRRVGWGWGGKWVGVKDYQHFSANGG
jgi:D-alanyl-D-alanine carboxypeptidase